MTGMGSKRVAPADTERCAHCLQLYRYELEVWCARCDAPLCPFCVVRRSFRAELVCPHCACEEDGD